MRQLLLLRHAKSASDDPKLPDHLRPLHPHGRQAATAMRQTMHRLGLRPTLVLVSTARRTLQTHDLLAPWDEAPLVQPMDALYLATPGQMLEILNTVPETVQSVLLLGHNPGLHELALRLAGGTRATSEPDLRRLAGGFPTAALAEFTVSGPWHALAPGGGELARFIAPADLPEMVA